MYEPRYSGRFCGGDDTFVEQEEALKIKDIQKVVVSTRRRD
jgi:hypothetical protein